MKHLLATATTLLAFSIAAPAFAGYDTGDGAYIAAGTVMYDNNDLIGIQGTVGYNFAKYFGVEGVFSTGIVSAEDAASTVSVGVDSSIAGFAVARMSSDEFSFYLKAGYHSTKFGGTVGNATTAITLDGIAGGLGADWFFSENSGVRFEAVSYDAKDLGVFGLNGMTVISLSYIHKFN